MNTATKRPPAGAPEAASINRDKAIFQQHKPLGHRPWWQIVFGTVLWCCAGIVALELFFNASGVGLEEILQPDAQLGTVHIPGKHVVWRMEGFSDGYLNAEGMRDREHTIAKPAGVYRIALLGDSATEGLQVSTERTYGRELERIYAAHGVKAEVLNFGCSGYGTGQEVLQYEQQAAQYKPDLTILLYNRGDATENIRKPWDIKTEPRPYFFLDGKGALHEDDAVLQVHKDTFKPAAVLDYLRKNSRIYGVFSHANLNLSINEPLFRKLRGWLTVSQNEHLLKEGKRYCTYMPQDSQQVTSALITRLDQDCLKGGSKLQVVTFPNINSDPEYASQIPSLEQLSKQEGFAFVDLTPLFHWYPQPMTLFVKFHFSEKGHKVVADKIFECLQKQISMPR